MRNAVFPRFPLSGQKPTKRNSQNSKSPEGERHYSGSFLIGITNFVQACTPLRLQRVQPVVPRVSSSSPLLPAPQSDADGAVYPLVEPFRYDTQHRCSHSSPESPPESPHLQFRPLVEGGRGEVHTAYVVGEELSLVGLSCHCRTFWYIALAHIARCHSVSPLW